jgi:hypothetical protein
MVRDVVSDFPKVSTVFQTIMNKEPAHNSALETAP